MSVGDKRCLVLGQLPHLYKLSRCTQKGMQGSFCVCLHKRNDNCRGLSIIDPSFVTSQLTRHQLAILHPFTNSIYTHINISVSFRHEQCRPQGVKCSPPVCSGKLGWLVEHARGRRLQIPLDLRTAMDDGYSSQSYSTIRSLPTCVR